MKRRLLAALLCLFTGGVMSQTPCEAEVIPTPVTADGFTKITSSNIGQQPSELALCKSTNDDVPVKWFTLKMDSAAEVLNVQVHRFDSAFYPVLAIYNGNCDDPYVLPINEGQDCAMGDQGEVIVQLDVMPDSTYFVAVYDAYGKSGEFDLFINTLYDASVCVISTDISITSRSIGTGDAPLYANEQITVCFSVDAFTPAGNGCQWFQGVVPIFGNGWDPASFNAAGMPLNATMNDSSFADTLQGVYGGSWSWYSDVHYNSDVSWFQLGDFDDNGSLDMCNSKFDPFCSGPGIMGGTLSGNCNDGGDVLPPGWFVANPIDGCPKRGHPDDDWGDGSGCGSTMGPWKFCFDLKVRDASSCASFEDLTINFFTFADGETGAWTGGLSTCAGDAPDYMRFRSQCQNPCNMIRVTSEVLECDSLGMFYVELDMELLELNNTQFSVTGSDENLGTFFYDELPVQIGPFDGNIAENWEFQISDLNYTYCFTTVETGVVSCVVNGVNTISGFRKLEVRYDSGRPYFISPENDLEFTLWDSQGQLLGSTALKTKELFIYLDEYTGQSGLVIIRLSGDAEYVAKAVLIR